MDKLMVKDEDKLCGTVRHVDYERLQRENERLTAQILKMMEDVHNIRKNSNSTGNWNRH